jgi:hypothetical protein
VCDDGSFVFDLAVRTLSAELEDTPIRSADDLAQRARIIAPRWVRLIELR